MDRALHLHPLDDKQKLGTVSQELILVFAQERSLQEILNALLDTVEAEQGFILVKENHLEAVRLEAARGYPGPLHLDPINSSLLGRLETFADAVQLLDLEKLEEPPLRRDGLVSWINERQAAWIIPILCRGNLVGALGLGKKKSGLDYSPEEIRLLQTLLVPVALAVQTGRQEAAIRELREVIATKDKFLSILAHDLRTPMTGIKGYASILRGTIKDESQKKYLDIVIAQIDRLSQMISDLLDILRYEEGRIQLKFAGLDLNQLLQEALRAFSTAAKEKNLTLEANLPKRTILVNGHRDSLFQVMNIFLSNAVKFTPKNGRVEVRLEALNRRIKFTVSDTGPGVPEEMQGRIFDRFQAAFRQVMNQGQGTGLSLALVRYIIEHHHGQVGVKSQAGQGSEFYFSIPLPDPGAVGA